MSSQEHWSSVSESAEAPARSAIMTLELGQRRAAVWPRLEPSVAHRTATDLLVGVVHTSDAVRFIAIACDETALLQQLASYVAANARDALWMADATRVRALLAVRDFEGAVRAYFTATERPWDRDWLVIERQRAPDRPCAEGA